jgi:hypothetical protein
MACQQGQVLNGVLGLGNEQQHGCVALQARYINQVICFADHDDTLQVFTQALLNATTSSWPSGWHCEIRLKH